MNSNPHATGKNNELIIKIILVFWFVSITMANLIESSLAFVIKTLPSYVAFIMLLLIAAFRKKDYNNNRNSTIFGGPVILYSVYLFSALISLTVSISPKYNYVIGVGYLGAYIVSLINVYLVFLILGKRYNEESNTTELERVEQDTICSAAYIAASVIVIFFLYRGMETGALLQDERLVGLGLGPAGIGLIAMIVFLYPISFGWTLIRAIICLLAIIMLYKGQARTPIVSIFAASMLILALKSRVLAIIGTVSGVSIILIFQSITNFVTDKVLFLNDQSRGQLGLSGRLEVWHQSWKMFMKNPILGIGFRMSDTVISSQNVSSSAHNAYLTSLIETGFIGTTLLLSAVIWGLWRLGTLAWNGRDRSALFYFGILSGSMVFGLAERFLFNLGNVTSLLCFFALFYSSSRDIEPEIVNVNE